jgi:hypothetical protein
MGIFDKAKEQAQQMIQNKVVSELKKYGIDDSVLTGRKIILDKVKAHSKEINDLLKKIIDGRKRLRSKSRSKRHSKKRSKRRSKSRSKKRSKRRY